MLTYSNLRKDSEGGLRNAQCETWSGLLKFNGTELLELIEEFFLDMLFLIKVRVKKFANNLLDFPEVFSQAF